MDKQSLRIFVVLPMYGGSLPIGRYCIKALEEMGHRVCVFEAPVLYNAYAALKKLELSPSQMAQIEEGFLQLVTQALLMQITSFNPDFLLALAQAPMGVHILQKLKQAKIKTAMWFVEDFRLFQYWKALAPLYDIFAVIQKEPFITELNKIGQNNVLYLPLAAQPGIHEKINLSEKDTMEYGSEIGFLGAGYPNRRLAFRPLENKDFKIWGSDWDNEEILKNNIQRNGERISEQESVRIYNATKININLHSSIHTDKLVSGGDFVNPRTFELAAIGAFQLVDERQLLGELFEKDEVATFNSIHDLYSKIDYFLQHEDERQKYIAKSRKRILQDHTYQKRMEKLLEFSEERLGKFAPSMQDDFLDKFYMPIKEDIKILIDKLDIGNSNAFEDVIERLRKFNGKLNEVEMALLFLDEFRKQYER